MTSLYLDTDVVTTTAVAKRHGDGVVYHIGRAVAGNSSHGTTPVVGFPAFDLFVIVVSFKKLTGPK